MPGLADILLDHGFVRATPPGQKMTAAYMCLTNSGAEDVVIEGVSIKIAARTEIHESYVRDGMMAMRQLPLITVPAGGRVELVPGGMHMMLFGVTNPLNEGEEVNIVLQYKNAASQQFYLPVQRQRMTSNHNTYH
tara:strand:- start:298 stop:702 length:405 start_codon:yes stop_codon:yes gene_type:complete